MLVRPDGYIAFERRRAGPAVLASVHELLARQVL